MQHSDFKDPIDIVISWVDGNDPVHRKKMAGYLTGQKDSGHDDVAGSTRFASIGEIRFCIASINRFAGFVRQIFIITDGQDPDLEDFMKMHFDNPVPMHIVDHRTIFKGYEYYLPTFNSRAIETMLWRIPGLSERFIYMNDDFLFTSPCTENDFFRGDMTVCYAEWYSTLFARALRLLKPKKKGHKPIGFKDSMLNAVDILGQRHRFLYLSHSPRALKKSFFEKFFKDRPDVMIRNIRHKFRDASQYNSQELFYLTEHRAGRCIVVSPKDTVLYMKPKKREGYVSGKLAAFDKKQDARFCCFNSLDQATDEEIRMVMNWMNDRLAL